jgi:ADP-heptose:LPS heptosyltransferase
MPQLRILIIRPDRIGDVVLSTPIPEEIKSNLKDCFIAVLVSSYTKDIYLNNPFIDEMLIYDKTNTIQSGYKLIRLIKKYNFTHAFMLLPTEQINWLIYFSGIKYRIGVGHKFYQFITNTKSVYRRKYKPLKHEAEYCMDMVRKLGLTPQSVEPEIYLTDEEKKKAVELKQKVCSDGELLIGINSTSGNSAPNWLPSEYRNLIDKLKSLSKIKIAITDNNPPVELRNIPGIVYPNFNNSLRNSIINFSTLDLLVSASTGPMHIAAALKVKTLSLFTRAEACSPELWGPLGNKSVILLPDEETDKELCFPDPKSYHFDGQGGINSRRVFEEIKNILMLK